jgi:hypothetical protein
MTEGAVCAPNMSAGARAVRMRVARAAAVFAVGALVVVALLHLAWWARLIAVLVPALVASAAYFEARSNVCVLRAAEGTFEHDDRSRTPMEATVLPAIRRAATSVIAKGVTTAVAASGVAVCLSLLV